MTDKKAELIAQLLAKAESTSPAEAEALTEHAERLMIKYGIEQAVIDARRAKLGQTHEQIVTKSITFKGTYQLDYRDLAHYVTGSLGQLKGYQSRGYSTTIYRVVGFESDVEQALVLIASLEVQASVALAAWWRTVAKRDFYWYSDSEKRRERSSFIRGFANGAAARIRETRNQEVKAASTGTDLVLVDRMRAVEERYDSLGLSQGRARYSASHNGFSDGSAAGLKANTGGRAVTNTRSIGAGR
jgi:hypothetical protein